MRQALFFFFGALWGAVGGVWAVSSAVVAETASGGREYDLGGARCENHCLALGGEVQRSVPMQVFARFKCHQYS